MMPDERTERAGDAHATASEDRWQAISAIVDASLDLPVEARTRFLDAACPADDVRREVERLLRACERSGGFLGEAVSAYAAPLLADSCSPQLVDDADALSRVRTTLAGRYSIERELGRGGMAIVYLARDHERDREVAVKVLRPELSNALGAERFLREIETMAGLRHPGILEFLASGDAHGVLWFAMPYVAGETLRVRLDRERRLPVDEALRVTGELADALGHAHRHDVLHRDLKPENVLLANGQAMLTDFGIACAITRAAGGGATGSRHRPLTGTGVSLGTPAYMSPEQARGSRTLDARSDIYALGCVLYEMLAGEPPFRGPRADAVIRQHLSAPVPDLTIVRDDVEPAIASALGRALSKSPHDRFATMEELARALTAPTPAKELRPRRWARLVRVLRLGSGIAWLAGLAVP